MAENFFIRTAKAIAGIFQQGKSANFGSNYRLMGRVVFDGQKNLGELGPVMDYALDYDVLRARGWDSQLQSEVARTVVGRFATWIISTGLKLQVQPNRKVLEMLKIKIDGENFNESTEAWYELWANSTDCDFAGMNNMAWIQEQVFLNAINGGDVLVVLRYVDDTVKVQIIDGCHLQSPMGGTDYYARAEENGNKIRHGIEIAPNGEHVAYWIKTDGLGFERIAAKSASNGLRTAFLVYGCRHRLNNNRGIPLMSAVLETLAKMERYKEATVGTAEEQAKVAFQVVHQPYSTGENTFSPLSKAFDAGNETNELPRDEQGRQLANTVHATTNKQAYNNPIGTKIETLQHSDGQLYFKDFYSVLIDLVCAAVGIPPNVAMSKYDSNFSASRAALKDWEHAMVVARAKFSAQFLQRVYEFWLDVQILQNKVQAPGYLPARSLSNSLNRDLLKAYRVARFTGPRVPHIDPLKEVNAERAKLGELGQNLPLTTLERATESLNEGDGDSNVSQFSEELSMAEELGVPPSTPKTVVAPPATDPSTNN